MVYELSLPFKHWPILSVEEAISCSKELGVVDELWSSCVYPAHKQQLEIYS